MENAKVYQFNDDLVLANDAKSAAKCFSISCCYEPDEKEMTIITPEEFDTFKTENGVDIAARIALAKAENIELPAMIYER